MIVLFDPGLTDTFRDVLPGLGDFFLFISQFGSELIFIGVLLLIYWSVNKREAILATYVLLIAVLSNYWLKVIIAKERPPVSNWYPGADAPNYSTPSGHAQYSATLYGWFTAKLRTWWMAIIAVVLTGLIGVSRVYLGVHYLGDILLGWAIGIITIILLVYFDRPIRDFLGRYNFEQQNLALFVIGLVMILIAAVLPEPPNENFGALGGLTIGLAIGMILEHRFVDFSVEPYEGQRLRLVLRVIIGLAFVLGIMLGLEPFLPSDQMWLRMIRYMLVALSGIFVWPAIFKTINL